MEVLRLQQKLDLPDMRAQQKIQPEVLSAEESSSEASLAQARALEVSTNRDSNSQLPSTLVSINPTIFIDHLRVVENGYIFNFKDRRFLDISTEGQDICREALSTFAKKLLKVTYFRWHRCLYSDIKAYIPLEIVLRFFNIDEWNIKINGFQRHLHARMLGFGLTKTIVGFWKESKLYPAYGAAVEDRIQIWENLVDATPDLINWFVAPIRESIDWPQIVRDNSSFFKYTKKSLVTIADAAFELERGIDRNRRTAATLNKVWERLALEDEWALLDQTRIPINPKFGGGEKTRKSAYVNALPQVELDDNDDQDEMVNNNDKDAMVDNSYQLQKNSSVVDIGKKRRQRKTKGQMTPDDIIKQKRRQKRNVAQFLLKSSAGIVTN